VRHVAAGTSRIGHTQLRRIGVGREPEDIPLDPDLQHLLLVLDDGAQRLGTVVVPAINAVVPGRVAGDAVLTNEHAWALLARHIVDPVYPDLDVARTDGRLIIRRCNTVLADVDDEPQADLRKAVANAAGWTIFLQELWGLPDWPSQDFYTVTHHRASEPSRSVVSAGAGAVRVEIATELPVIVSDPAHGGAAPDIDVEVSLGGVPFIALRVPAVDGHLQPDRLRRAITLIGKYELFRVAMREAILTGEWPAEMPVRARLQELAARRSQAAATADNSTDAFPDDKRASALLGEWLPSGRRAVIVGRRTTDRVVGTAGRSAVFPFEKADLLARAAQTANQLVAARGGSGDLVGIGLYAPWLFEPSSAAICCDPDADRLARELDDVFAAGEDPWDYTSPYEQRKYDDTLALVPEQVDTALDVGCAEGIFTQRLAARARKLTAIDVSAVALARAKRRCADLPNVDFRQQNLFAGPLPSAADLIVCGEMLYFARDRGELACGVRNLVDALKPGGLLIVTHVNAVVDDPNAPGFDWDVPFGAAGIEGMILSDRRVALTRERITPMYRAQAYERIPRLRRITRAARASRVSERSNNVPELDPALARRFLVDGGSVRRVDRDAQTDRLPILMYHRIAPAAATCYRRWTTTPREFEQQLGWLDSHGYSSVSIDEWAAAAAEDLVLSGRRVILSFDDGYEDFCTYAVPLLLKYGFEAELFVASGRVGATNAWEAPGAPRYPLMDWSTLAALPPRTVRIGSHTVTHPLLITSSADDTIRELVESRTTLEERLGRQITSVAYPYGPADGAVRHLTGVAGYEYGYTTSDGCAYRDTDPLALPRIEIRGGEPIASFGRLVSGGGEQ
jgi:peptidoglycan/xylan/chitin deacetylase (PgdA/CDA1 family)/ubiquinone/menaquinone biosynthesis C-methylase UbiE